ncbi:proline oxidase [Colletotrichum karsti]|uniref:Proline dehydrogenase n=1 Tax=Colletotrichum karsti TaxID=1095194 RepID=A0A9P6LGI7_9PEZI|nr:proline oxidase [Colletotrichum karsti]KAF9872578.1 proline oxidase [Colletotrichum karsti]
MARSLHRLGLPGAPSERHPATIRNITQQAFIPNLSDGDEKAYPFFRQKAVFERADVGLKHVSCSGALVISTTGSGTSQRAASTYDPPFSPYDYSIVITRTTLAFAVDNNPVLRVFLKHTFYAQFCAGENPAEVGQTIANLKSIGFTGVILGYAKEVVLSDAQTKDLASCGEGKTAEECIRIEINPWAHGTMETVKLAQPGDFVALKFTGAGRQALYTLSERLPPSEALTNAIDAICSFAAVRGVRLLFDAEQTTLQPGIDDWTIDYMRKYNKQPGKAVIYGTYQAYLKSTPQTLQRHLDVARDEGFTLGVKLVRGAYIGSDPRHLIHDTKSDTDAAYDGIAESLLRKQWGDVLKGDSQMPPVSLVLASHNAESVRMARAICDAGEAKIDIAFAQLQGMADEVSCELVLKKSDGNDTKAQAVEAYKYLVWGSTGECMKYLLRRAHENRDAVQRTRSGRDAMWSELVRRIRGVIGISL